MSSTRIPLVLERTHGQQALVPAMLQLAGDQAVVRIDRIVLPPCPTRFVARLLQGQLDLAPLLRRLGVPGLHRADRRLDAERL